MLKSIPLLMITIMLSGLLMGCSGHLSDAELADIYTENKSALHTLQEDICFLEQQYDIFSISIRYPEDDAFVTEINGEDILHLEDERIKRIESTFKSLNAEVLFANFNNQLAQARVAQNSCSISISLTTEGFLYYVSSGFQFNPKANTVVSDSENVPSRDKATSYTLPLSDNWYSYYSRTE